MAERHVTISQQMAEFVFDLEWSDVPTHVEIAARRHLADTLACAVGAYREQPVRALRDYAVETRSRGGATLLGSSERTSPSMASLVNGTMVRYLDANDISSFGGGHFSDGIPPLLAVAEDRGHSAGDLVLSVIALYEIQGALARSFDFMHRGYHALTQIPWTVPIVATRLVGGDREAAVNAAGLSGATGMILNTWLKPTDTIPSIKGVAVGLAGQRSVECAELALRGVSASHDALEFAFETLGKTASPPPDPPALPRPRIDLDDAPPRHQVIPIADLHPGGGRGGADSWTSCFSSGRDRERDRLWAQKCLLRSPGIRRSVQAKEPRGRGPLHTVRHGDGATQGTPDGERVHR